MATCANFNSIKVRLEPDSWYISYDCIVTFQFHKGAIRTVVKAEVRLVSSYFNSIKVRLEQNQVRGLSAYVLDFNSIKVRLELNKNVTYQDNQIDFNSIKVRLEPSTLAYHISTAPFQFHKGAIRTARLLVLIDLFQKFQFHKGAIRTRVSVSEQIENFHFNSIKVRLEHFQKVQRF